MKALDLDKLDAFMEIEYDGEIYSAYTENDIDDKAINVIPIPDNATNGDIIKSLFPNCEQKEHIINGYFEMYFDNNLKNANYMRVKKSWWNAPYKTESER